MKENLQKKIILVDPRKGCDKNDGAAAPVATVARALALAKDAVASPSDVTVRFASGEYQLAQTAELDLGGANENSRLTLTADGEATFTGVRLFDPKGWEKVDGKPYYRYQLKKDAAGAYPHFRFLFVNGKITDVAKIGYDRSYDALMAGTKMFQNKENMPGHCAKEPWTGDYKLYLDLRALEPLRGADPADYAKLKYHMPRAWYFDVLRVLRIDFDDTRRYPKTDTRNTVIDKNGDPICNEDGYPLPISTFLAEYDGTDKKIYDREKRERSRDDLVWEDCAAVYFDPKEIPVISTMHGFAGEYYWLQNALPFVRNAGDYYYDEAKGIVYYVPENGMDLGTAKIGYSVCNYLVAVKNSRHLTVEGITFTGTDSTALDGLYTGGQAQTAHGVYGNNTLSALYVENAEDFILRDCTFRELGASGARIRGVITGAKLCNNRFFRIGSSGLDLGSRDGTWKEGKETYRNIEIAGNYLDDIAWFTRGSVAMVVSMAHTMEVHHNTLRNTSYSAMSFGWRWCPGDWKLGDTWHLYHVNIHHNYFEDYMTDQSDGGAIYILGGNVENECHELFNEMHHNYAVYTPKTWDGKGMVMPYYHDGGSSNWRTHDNVEILYPGRAVHAAIYLQNIPEQYAHNILVENNHLVAALGGDRRASALSEKEKEYAIFGEDWSRPKMDNGRLPTRADPLRDLAEKNNTLYDFCRDLPKDVIASLADMGSPLYRHSVEATFRDMDARYVAYYEKKGI